MNAEREIIDIGTFTSEVEDAYLGVCNTSIKPRFRVRLY